MDSTKPGDLAAELAALDEKVNALLPPRYQHCYETVSPTSMGSAGLKYDRDGKVAWDQIWTSYCDLALAGGPPHRGKLLEPGLEAEIQAEPEKHREAIVELDRAIGLTAGMRVVDGYAPGWIGVPCASPSEAAWLQFAVTGENVSARRRGADLQLPAGPNFRAEKEIKNVVVALSKSLHYWDGHLSDTQQKLAGESVWEPATPDEVAADPARYEEAFGAVEAELRAAGAPATVRNYTGWIGVETADDEEAVWLLRAILVGPILARREEHILYLPVGAQPDAGREGRVGKAFGRAWALWQAQNASGPAWRPSGRGG